MINACKRQPIIACDKTNDGSLTNKPDNIKHSRCIWKPTNQDAALRQTVCGGQASVFRGFLCRATREDQQETQNSTAPSERLFHVRICPPSVFNNAFIINWNMVSYYKHIWRCYWGNI